MAQSVWTGGSHHTGLAALPHENIQQVFKSDLLVQMERLGYKQYNYVKFKGYGIDNSDDNQLAIAMMRVDVTNKSEVFWLKAKCIINNLLKL